MWRIEVQEIGREPLPPVDLPGDELLLGSGPRSAVRLPAAVARPRHLVVRKLGEAPLRIAWLAEHALSVQGQARRAGDSGEAEAPLSLELGSYRITVGAAPAGSRVTSPARTESLARELLRNLMGASAPRLVVERGPEVGSSRTLGAPESRLRVGRGDEADWVILDEDLSRVHAEISHTWEGARVRDLGSKNGTRVDGAAVAPGGEGAPLRDGSRLELGDVRLRFVDDAEAAAQEPSPAAQSVARPAERPTARASRGGSLWLAAVAALLALLALAAAGYLLVAG